MRDSVQIVLFIIIPDSRSEQTIMFRRRNWYSSGIKPNKQMNEMNYLSGEFTDDFLHAQADVGDYILDEEGFRYRPTQDEMKKLALEGQSLLFIDSLKGK